MFFLAVEIAKFGNQVFEALQDDIEKLKGRAEQVIPAPLKAQVQD